MAMGKPKRRRDDGGDGEAAVVDGSANKRLKRIEDGAQLAKLYDDLADDVQAVRIKAAGDLLKLITSDPQQKTERLGSAQQRLIRGLCSGRKAARLGFSIALTELFRLSFNASDDEVRVRPILSDIDRLTATEGNVGGQERRDSLLGRRFAYQALLQSDVLLQSRVLQNEWTMVVEAILHLAQQKQWLRREVLGMLHDYLKGPSAEALEANRLELVLHSALEKKLLTTLEGVGLWVTVREQFPATRMPKKVWRKDDPLSKQNFDLLRKVLADEVSDDEGAMMKSGTRQALPSFAWEVILSRMFKLGENSEGKANDRFVTFWTTCVSTLYFSEKSSSERRALGLQIFSLAVTRAPASYLPQIIDEKVLRCIQDQRAKPDNTLFELAKAALNKMVARAEDRPEDAFMLLQSVLDKGIRNFDQNTKTKTVESIVAVAKDDAMEDLAAFVRQSVLDNTNSTDAQTEARRHSMADIVLLMVRTHKDEGASLGKGSVIHTQKEPEYRWMDNLLDLLSRCAYTEADLIPVFRPKLMSILNTLMTGPLNQALQAPVFVARKLRENVTIKLGLPSRAKDAVENAYRCIDKMYLKGTKDNSTDSELRLSPEKEPFALLFSLSILQVHNDDADAIEVLEDLLMCYESLEDGGDSITILVELLLSFVSKPSALFRKLTEQVFTAVASEMTADSLQSLLDILEQKESLSGQQELFHLRDGKDNEEEVNADEVDLDDMSDVELVNGEPITAFDSSEEDDMDDDEGSSSDAEDGAVNGENDEEAVFDKKLAEALGTGRLESDESDDDGSDMDDEQMMALEPHLTSIFKERQKNTSKKQERKDAKENIVNFKNRVLDLLAIFVKSQHASILAVDTVLPLTRLARTTTNKQTGERAFAILKQYFDACSKKKEYPQPPDSEVVLSILAHIHNEMELGGSKLHASACSRSSLFIAKVLIGMDKSYFERIAEMYAATMSQWWQDAKSKVQPSIFTEWTSWSITTRKQV